MVVYQLELITMAYTLKNTRADLSCVGMTNQSLLIELSSRRRRDLNPNIF